jgi:soluble lytic murein transglycosylase-like protein
VRRTGATVRTVSRRLATLAAVALVAAAAGCGSERSEPRGAASAEAPAPGPRGAATADAPAPGPSAPIPRRPGPLARALAENSRALLAAIDSWRHAGAAGRPPREVMLRALYHQRAHIVLSSSPRLAARVIARLPADLAAEARDLVWARRALGRLAGPAPPLRHWEVGRPLPPRTLMRCYRRAEHRFGVSRRVLAAVNLVETAFNRLRNHSTSGARGPMQFIPSTWRRYGMGGDVDDPRDAIMGAANYLHASGAPHDYGRALYAYNPSPLYVGAVLRYARRMRRDFRSFYVLYGWQVFVRTRSGRLLRFTGP